MNSPMDTDTRSIGGTAVGEGDLHHRPGVVREVIAK